MAPKDVHAQNLSIYGKRVFGGVIELGGEVILYCLFCLQSMTLLLWNKKNPLHLNICLVAGIHRGVSMCRKSCKNIMLQTLFFSLTLFTFFFTILYTEVFCCWVAKSCPTPWDPTDWSPPGSSVCGISQARILEWVGYFLLYVLYCSDGPSVTTRVP